MLRENGKKEIKVEQKDDQQSLISSRIIENVSVKIEIDDQLFPPIMWAPLRYSNLQMTGGKGNDVKIARKEKEKWTRVMRKILISLLNSFVTQKQLSNFITKFKKWKHSNNYIFAILMYVLSDFPNQSAFFYNSYKEKIQKMEENTLNEGDISCLQDSINFVMQFLFGTPASAIDFFIERWSSSNPRKASDLIKIIQKTITEKHQPLDIDISHSVSGSSEQQSISKQPQSMRLRNSVKQISSSRKPSKEESQLLKQGKRATLRINGDPLLIYKKGDSLKIGLYPLDMNFTLKNSGKDLISLQ